MPPSASPSATPSQTMQGRGLVITLGCLLGTALLLAMSTVLAKLSSPAGLAPLPYLAWTTLGSGIALFAIAAARGILAPFNARTIEFWGFCAIVSMAAPFMLVYSAVPHVGAGFVALALSFPPFLTYLGTLAFGVERFSALRAAGVALALSGAALLALAQLSLPGAGSLWVIATLIAPVLLASGNVYRAKRWPAGMRPESLAPGMLAGAGLLLLPAGLLPGQTLAIPMTQDALVIVLLQTLNFTVQYTLFFILQHRGGAVMLSLIGAVAAVFGVPFAILVLGEAAPPGLLVSAGLIGTGVWLTSWGGLRQARKPA